MNSFFRIPALFLTFALSSTWTPAAFAEQATSKHSEPAQSPSFADHYKFIKQEDIRNFREGIPFTQVCLYKDSKGDFVTVKKYSVQNENFKQALEKSGTCVQSFIEKKAENAWMIGRFIEHPNVIKTKEVYLEDNAAYIVMENVKGIAFEPTTLTFTTKRAVMLQFLNVVEALLLKNIVIEDLRIEDFILEDERLTLFNLDNGRMLLDEDLSLGHYIYTIERMLLLTSSSQATKEAVSNCFAYLPNEMKGTLEIRERPITSEHVPYLLIWFDALRAELVRFY